MPAIRHFEAREIALIGVFAAVTLVCTLLFTVSITATQGYFNLGEIAVYVSAFVLGPYLGAIAGGIGSATSDLIVAPQYAPGTLIIKGVEAFLVGFVAEKKPAGLSITQWRGLSTLFTIIACGGLFLVGTTAFSGVGNLLLGVSPFLQDFPISVPVLFWVIVCAILGAVLLLLSFRVDPGTGWLSLAILIGGSEMVTGYFLYEYFVLGVGGALAEVPFNIGQMLVGLTVGLPLAKTLRMALPSISHRMNV